MASRFHLGAVLELSGGEGEIAALTQHSVEGCHLGSSLFSRHVSLGHELRHPLCVHLSGNHWLQREQAVVRLADRSCQSTDCGRNSRTLVDRTRATMTVTADHSLRSVAFRRKLAVREGWKEGYELRWRVGRTKR
jgi:hypothetical protein